MTPQEAHKHLEDIQRIMTQNREVYKKYLIEANGQAILALEKQIPKKPILDTIFPSGVEWYLCPTCNHNNIEKCDCYCHNCGQALDWSDTEQNELNPCPFCGSENVSLVYWNEAEKNTKVWEEYVDNNGATFPMVECRDCESTVIFAGRGYGKEVIRAYNKRSAESG